jgi:hypothetical protein
VVAAVAVAAVEVVEAVEVEAEAVVGNYFVLRAQIVIRRN